MTNLQSFLQRACQDLGMRIVIPFSLELREGVQINAEALMPQLGGINGMIIVSRYSDLCGVASELSMMGYGYSVLSGPLPSEEYDLENYTEMFSDWGWGSADERAPDWMC